MGGRDGLPQKTVGPYQLMAQLGQSSHGPIYVARLPGNDAVFALKRFRSDRSGEESSRIREAIQSVTRLDHPGIQRPIDVGTDRGALYVVTEHASGMTLQERLSKEGPLGSLEAAELVANLAAIVQSAHHAGVLHLDLRPSSVLVGGPGGGVVIRDFGLGPAYDQDTEQPDSSDATLPLYQAPEQVQGLPGDVRTDVYGLGALLYELLTCAPPFEGRTRSELTASIQEGRLVPPGERIAGVHPRVEAACLRALSTRPRKRQASAAALARELQRASRPRAWRLAALLVLVIWTLTVSIPVAWALRERGQRLRAVDEAAEQSELAAGEQEVLREEVEAGRRALDEERRRAILAQDESRRLDDRVGHLRQVEIALQQRLKADAETVSQTVQRASTAALILREVHRRVEEGRDTLAWRLQLHMGIGRADLAEALLAKELSQAGQLTEEVWPWAYQVYRLRRMPAQAQAVLEQMQALREGSPKRVMAEMWADPRRATPQALAALIEADPSLVQARQWLARAMLNAAGQNPQALGAAVKATQALLELDPVNAQAHSMRASALALLYQQSSQQELPPQIVAGFKHAQALSSSPVYHLELGRFYMLVLGEKYRTLAAGELLSARATGLRMESWSDVITADLWLGNLAVSSREPQLALGHYKAALEFVSKQQQFASLLGVAVPYLAALSDEQLDALLGPLDPRLFDMLSASIRQARER